MKITEDQAFASNVLKAIAEREFNNRTGVHQSDLNYCLNKQALRKLQPKEDTDQETLIYSIGWATQRWLTSQNEDEPEKEVDGIIVTCDATTDGCPWELKATYQSSNRPIEDNINWMRQLMAQCYIMKTTTVYLTRFELLGDWGNVYPKGSTKEERAINRKASQRPTLHAYRIEFTQEEIDRNWAWLGERRKLYLEILETGNLLPKVIALPPGGSYECDYCPYRGTCEDGQTYTISPSKFSHARAK